TYDKAHQKLRRAEETDDVQTSTDQEKGRGKRRRMIRRISSSDDSDEVDLENFDIPEPPFRSQSCPRGTDDATRDMRPAWRPPPLFFSIPVTLFRFTISVCIQLTAKQPTLHPSIRFTTLGKLQPICFSIPVALPM
ncbi:hypothetical protein V5799_000299, partial [Amblyomma americanum]